MSDDLAQRQADLVRTLVDGGDPPPGFDPDALVAAAEVLRHKRATSPQTEPTHNQHSRRTLPRWLGRRHTNQK